MKKLLIAAALLCAASFTASASTVTATATDTDGQPWNNCTFSATLTIPGSGFGPAPSIGGVPVAPLTVKGTCSASGVITASLTDTSTVDQAGAKWVFKVCPNASVLPVTVTTTVIGSTPNLTPAFSQLAPPRFAAGDGAFGYSDIEVVNPLVGVSYFNTGALPGSRKYTFSGWTGGGGGGGGPFDPLGAAGQATATVTIAASNSPSKAFANVVATGTNDQNTINAAIASACPAATGTNVVQCKVLLLPGVYNLSGSIVINTDDWNLVGIGHAMWGGFFGQWQGGTTVSAGSCASNLCTFTVGSLLSTTRPAVMIGFTGTGASSINNFTCLPGSPTSTSFTCTIPGTGTIASTGAGLDILVNGAVGNGGAQLIATGPGFPLVSTAHTGPCGTASDTSRCRGWKIENIYGVCYGYSGDFLDAASGANADDNIMVSDNIIQRCNHGITGAFDSPTFKDNSFQDNTGDFFHASADYIKAQNNLIFDNGGFAYNFQTAGKGGSIVDRAWGDLVGGFTGATNNISIGGFTAFNVGSTNVQPVINLTGSNNIIHDLSMNMNNNASACIVLAGATGGAVTGNVCNRSAALATLATDSISISGSGVAASGNSVLGLGTTMQAQALNLSACTNCAVGINAAPGTWNFGGPPITVGTGGVSTGNVAVTKTVQGIASINSANLLERFQATNASPATNGSTITAWTDSSGLGYNITSIFGTPTFTTSSPINSLPAISFNGTTAGVFSSTVIAASTPTPTTQERIYWIVFNQTTAATSVVQNLLSEGNGTRNIFMEPTTNVLAVFSGTGGSFVSTIVPTLNATHVLEVVMNGTTSRLVLDGTSVATFSASNSLTSNSFSLGAKGSPSSQFFGGFIAEAAGYNGGNPGAYAIADAQALGAAYCTAYAVTCGTSW